MKEQECSVSENKHLTYYLDGGGDLYRAVCPELDIAYMGGTPIVAAEGLFELAKAEVRGIISGKGDLPGVSDKRRSLAELFTEIEDMCSVFVMVSGPAPERGGLK